MLKEIKKAVKTIKKAAKSVWKGVKRVMKEVKEAIETKEKIKMEMVKMFGNAIKRFYEDAGSSLRNPESRFHIGLVGSGLFLTLMLSGYIQMKEEKEINEIDGEQS